MDLKEHLWYLGFLVLVVLFFYSPHLHLDLYPNTQYFEDGGVSDLQKHFAPSIFMIKEGNYFWNDYSFGGEPFFGIPNKFTFYPFLLIFLLFDKISWIANLSILFHLLLAAISMYFLGLRIFNGKKEEATIASIMFVLGGFMFSVDYLNYLDFLFAYSLLPLILLFYFNIGKSKKNILFCSLFLALQYYSGAIEIFLLTSTLIFLLTVYFVLKREKLVVPVLILYLLCFALIAPKLLSDLDFVSKSSREGAGIDHKFPGPFFPTFGSVFSRLTNIPSGYQPPDVDITIGVFGLVLLLLSLGKTRLDFVKFLWFLVLISFLLTLATPLYTLVHKLPLYSKMSYINRFMLFFAVSACFLAGYGYRFLKEKLNFKYLFFAVLVLLLSSFYFLGYYQRDFENFDAKLDKVPVLEFIKAQDGLFRVFYLDVLSKEAGFIDWSFNSYLLRNKIHNVDGYDGNIVVQDYVKFLKKMKNNQLNLFGLLNVKYLISENKIPGLDLVKKFETCNDCLPKQINGPYLYFNPLFRERAYIVDHAILFLDEDLMWKALYDERFNENKNLVFFSANNYYGDRKIFDAVVENKNDYIKLNKFMVKDEGGKVEINGKDRKRIYSFDKMEKGFLVLSENFWNYGNWKGEKLYKVNGINTGIILNNKDGVELNYFPTNLVIGVVVLIFVLNLIWFMWKRI